MWFSSKKSPAESDLTTRAPGGDAGSAAGSVLDFLKATVSRVSRDRIPVDQLDVRAHLLDSGYVDSLTATELLAELERRYRVRIEEMDMVGRLCTLEALAREIEARAGSAGK